MFMDVMNASDPLQIQLASLPQANLSPRSTTNPKRFLEGHSQECDTCTRQAGATGASGPAVSPGRERGMGPKASDPKDGSGHFLKAQSSRTALKRLISNMVSKYCQLIPEPGSVLSSRVLQGHL